MGRWVDRWVSGWGGWIDGGIEDGWMIEKMDGWTVGGWMDRTMSGRKRERGREVGKNNPAQPAVI